MKIYSKSNVAAGLLCLIAFVLNVLNIIETDWWFLPISIAFAAKFLYTGLTKTGSERAKHMDAHYEKTARMLHGKHHAVKRNLPWILTLGFFTVALMLRFGFEIWLPVWVYVVFVLGLTVAAFYSMGLNREITEYIDEHLPQEEAPDL